MKARKSHTRMRIALDSTNTACGTKKGPRGALWTCEVNRRLGAGRFLGDRRIRRQAGIHTFAQGLARLEVRHQLLGNRHLLAAARVAAHARRATIDREAAEP